MYILKYRRLFPVKLLQKPAQSSKMSSETASKPIAAICHMRSTCDKQKNLEQIRQIIKEAKSKLAKMVFIPECCDFVGESRVQTLELSEPLDGRLLKIYCDLAKTDKIWLSLGGVHEALVDSEGIKANKIYNTHVIINDLGEITAVYRKLHLFDVTTPDFKFKESEVVEKGREIVSPVKTPVGKIGLQICYDMRFSEPSLILSKQGAEILTYPSAFSYSTGKAHWEILLRARAIENQCYVIAPAQIGWHNKKRQSFGRGMIIDPWGKVIAECDSTKDIDVSVAEIDLCSLKTVRENMPCFDHRRSDIYSLIPLSMQHCSEGAKHDQSFAEHTIDKRTIFYETDLSFAFTNIRCVVPGHVLVATKRIARRLKDLTTDEISDIFQVVVKIQKMLEPMYGASSSTVNVQDGPDSGQTVAHVHFHIMPRRKGDFAHNDLIYTELNKHDHCPETAARSLKERIDEAEKYRQKLKCIYV
ncbi:nitrilase and fragile histidine triad fusion protein NitFhit [Condylostylus longicornis]|uniref:nitrilase and fragile histidine triad fusion protein NitFhit n=1 Tax=Condylostylus longicornis TaxID=2530218 RepID=UPI00244E50BC|nr:nitrilase and fragile histidine triad fusion protein NitFhit [Condylostylus longicornis]